MVVSEYNYILEAIEVSGNSKVFRMFPEKERLKFMPGQFVKVSKEDKSIGRPYSIASPPEWEFLEFLIKTNVGEFTKYLDDVKIGTKFIISKASGHMVYNGERNAVFIAGGTGIAPIMSMLRYIKNSGIKGDFTLFYSSRTFNDISYYSELKLLEGDGAIKFVPILTREKIKGFENEHINYEMIRRYIKDTKKYNYFMCGNIKMVQSIRKSLIENGVEKEKIKVEGWG